MEGHDFLVEDASGAPVPPGDLSELLTSGNRLVVHSGQARILLEGGGDVVICGAAQLQVLKAQGAVTIALDFGTLRVHVKGAAPISIFSPLVLATPVSIGGGEREITLGLEQNGQMCLRAMSGAVRVAQQLSGESLLVPQFGGLMLSGGQLNVVASTAPGCTCQPDSAKLSPWRAIGTQSASVANISHEPIIESLNFPQIASPLQRATRSTIANPPPSSAEPAMTMFMPALVFNASGPEPPPEPGPDMSALVRSVRIRENTIIRGTVEAKGNHASPPPAPPATSSDVISHAGVMDRIGNFFSQTFRRITLIRNK